jgi:hypothetical protein
MKKYEYNVLTIHVDQRQKTADILTEWGLAGWRTIQIFQTMNSHQTIYLEREIQQ